MNAPTRKEIAMKLERVEWSGTKPPDEGSLRKQLEEEGFTIFCWQDGPGADYEPHSHEHDESLWMIEGQMTFGAGGREWSLAPGDRLMLPKGTVHIAVAGPQGAKYLIGQKEEAEVRRVH
jgi:quercetin dioxygenase-like cupin family protein